MLIEGNSAMCGKVVSGPTWTHCCDDNTPPGDFPPLFVGEGSLLVSDGSRLRICVDCLVSGVSEGFQELE